MVRKINDHAFWGGSSSKKSVLPQGVKMKEETSAEGAGHLSSYQDTTETIKSQQEAGISKAKSRPLKSSHRN